MNIIETLPKTFVFNNIIYTLGLHVTAFNRLCICYREMFKRDNQITTEILCSVCVEPENEPRRIEDTIGYFNEYIGNAKTLDNAVLMLKNYLEQYIMVDSKFKFKYNDES